MLNVIADVEGDEDGCDDGSAVGEVLSGKQWAHSWDLSLENSKEQRWDSS